MNMKNITNYLFIALSIVLISSSCTVQKRLHNPGYHVQLHKNMKVEKTVDKVLKADEELAFAEVKTDETNLPKIEKQEQVKTGIVATTETETNYSSDLASTDEAIAFQSTNSPKRSLIQAKSTVENQPVVAKQHVEKKAKIKTAEKAISANSAGGVALLVLIILCLFPFINLIPVYITDGGITLNFWITLLLNFTYIGGVIFALLVVLGIVSLA